MTDLIIIGAGPGGYETAVKAAKMGKQVVVIEQSHLGGTCLNEGCIPTKCLCKSAEVLEEVREATAFGVDVSNYNFDLSKAIERKNNVVAQLISGIELLMKTPGVTLMQGKAQLKDSHTVVVENNGEQTEVSAENIIIATGSVSKFLPIEGNHSRDVVTSTELLQRTSLPHHLCVIGGGVIGLEFASIFRSFGSEVTVVEFCKEILPNLDSDAAKRLRLSLKKKGITFHTGAAVTAIVEKDDDTSDVVFTEKGKENSLNADLVLMAVGRAANVGSLNLADVGIDFSPRGIAVDDCFMTNVPGIYAIGDVNGICPLAHAATYQGYRVLQHLYEPEAEPINTKLVPSAVFTVPELACVGESEDSLKAQETPYEAMKYFYRANGKSLAQGSDEGFVKILADAQGKVLGCQILGLHASDLIHEVTLLMSLGGTTEQLANTIHAHPTLSEVVMKAVEK